MPVSSIIPYFSLHYRFSAISFFILLFVRNRNNVKWIVLVINTERKVWENKNIEQYNLEKLQRKDRGQCEIVDKLARAFITSV